MNISFVEEELVGTIVHVTVDGQYAGYILIADEIKEDSVQAIKDLKEANIKKTVMLTGDNQYIAEKVAAELALDEVYAELLPLTKLKR